MLTSLPTFTVILSILGFVLQDAVLSVSASDLILGHFSVVADLQIPSNHSRNIPQTIKYWKLQSINIEAFEADIKNSELTTYPKTNATGLAKQDDSVLQRDLPQVS